MKAVYIKEFGGPENLEIREVPDPPKPEANEVLVRVRAAGLNRADLLQRRGHYPPPSRYHACKHRKVDLSDQGKRARRVSACSGIGSESRRYCEGHIQSGRQGMAGRRGL